VGPKSVGASEGFLGWIAYLGAANAGVPLSIIVRDYGWSAYFTTLISSCCVALLLLMPMVNLKSFVQREEDKYKKEEAAAASDASGGADGAPDLGGLKPKLA
jgi:MFS transporter, OPA family, sugar phosphate sensor protein UhpC